MELITFTVPKSLDEFYIAFLGDFQYSGKKGPTTRDILKRHIDRLLKKEVYFFGVGDYIDFPSPGGRKKLKAADLHDTQIQVIADKANELNEELFKDILEPTTGRWIGMLEGHHFYEGDGWTTDESLCKMLKTEFLGTSAMVKIPNANNLTIWGHHGVGTGPKLKKIVPNIQGADVYVMGHNTRLNSDTQARIYPEWGKKREDHKLGYRDIHIIQCGGFAAAYMVGNRVGAIKRGGYAEQAMYPPSPLKAPMLYVDMTTIKEYFNESVWALT